MTTRRQQQVSELLHEEISQLIQYGTSDPRLGFVTVTGVEVSPDLHTAHVYFTVLGDEQEIQNSLLALENAAGYFRYELSQSLYLRYIPQLVFKLDTSIERGARMEALLDTLKAEADLNPTPPEFEADE